MNAFLKCQTPAKSLQNIKRQRPAQHTKSDNRKTRKRFQRKFSKYRSRTEHQLHGKKCNVRCVIIFWILCLNIFHFKRIKMLTNCTNKCQSVNKNLWNYYKIAYYFRNILAGKNKKWNLKYSSKLFLLILLLLFCPNIFGQEVKEKVIECKDKDYDCLKKKYNTEVNANSKDAELCWRK